MWALLSYFTPSRESRSRFRFAPLQFSAIVAGKLPIPADMKEPSSDDWLPPGWKVEMKLTSTGRKYKVVFASTSLSHSRVSAQFVLIFVAFFLFFLIGALVSVFPAGVWLAFRKLVSWAEIFVPIFAFSGKKCALGKRGGSNWALWLGFWVKICFSWCLILWKKMWTLCWLLVTGCLSAKPFHEC